MNPAGSEIGPSELQALRSAGLVSARGYAAAVDAVRDEAFWARWGMRALLALGVGQFLAGVVFFFAYNWNDLSDIAKFAVIEVRTGDRRSAARCWSAWTACSDRCC